tara:strand:+ start:12778 stop:12894 length:117 start_codon:yes stop_codon:yes gene_type:complete
MEGLDIIVNRYTRATVEATNTKTLDVQRVNARGAKASA